MKSLGYKKYILGAVLFFLVVVHLIAFNVKEKENLNILERGVLFIAFPVQKLITTVVDKVDYIWKGYIFLVDLRETNLALGTENQSLRNKLGKIDEIKAENERLRKLLAFAQESEAEFVAARVIATGPSSLYHTIIINKGFESGIKRGMAVYTNDGIVGQISYVKKNYASVLTIIDPNSAIDAIDQVTRARGILSGYRSQKMVFKYLPFSEKIKVGDRVLSSGLDGIYPKGLFVGDIIEINTRKEDLFQNVIVKPAVDFSRLEEVLVNLIIKEKIEVSE